MFLKLPTHLSSWGQKQEKHLKPQSIKKTCPVNLSRLVPSLPPGSCKANSFYSCRSLEAKAWFGRAPVLMIVPQSFSLCPGAFQALPEIQGSPEVEQWPRPMFPPRSLSLALLLTEHQHVLGSTHTWSQPQMASKATIFFNLVLKCSFRNFINLQGLAEIVGGAAFVS